MKRAVTLLVYIILCSAASAAGGIDIDKIENSMKISMDYVEKSITENENGCNVQWFYGDYAANAYIGTDGAVLSYTSDKTATSGIPELSKEEARGIASSFVLSAASDIIGEIDRSMAEISYSGRYNVTFYRKKYGILYKANYLTVGIDCNSGEVLSYSRVYSAELNFFSFASVLDAEQSRQIFKENNGLELRYNKKIVDKRVYAYPVYAVNTGFLINAVNGEIVPNPPKIDYENYFDVTATYEKTNDNTALKTELLSASAAQQTVRRMPELGITDDYQIVQARYLKNYDGKYLIILDFDGGNRKLSVTLDAQSGIVCEFSGFGRGTDAVPVGTNTKRAAVMSYLNKYMPEYLRQTRLASVSGGEKTVFLFERTVNNIPYKSNGICIAADEYANITNISFLWDDIEFPTTDNVLSYDDAYAVFNLRCGLELSFFDRDGLNIPVMGLRAVSTGIIDGITGQILTYDGKPAGERQRLAYLDLDTHYSAPQVTKMADCDIYVSRGNVLLSDHITQKDFLLLISAYLPDGKPVSDSGVGELSDGALEMLYNAFTAAGVITADEADLSGAVTREQAVKYFISTLGYSEVASAENIFTSHFADRDAISENCRGYVELARAMGIISGSEGYFSPKEYISNGDSLIMVYNYLLKSRR